MNPKFKNIYQVISSYIEISDEEWAYYSSMLQVKVIRKKSIVLSEGNICKEIFFINKGLLRIFFVDNNGEEKTFHFALENTFATDYKSFLKELPSNYLIQAMEDTEVAIMSLEMVQLGYNKLKHGEKLGRLLAEDYFFMFNDKIQAIYTQTPLERYNNLTTSFPEIFQRVPQHLIASYLNISSVHLSRLKNSD
ncbi:Crp/Fnr family transcriptional regulator [Polaribacter sp. ALD11]|uniref:Crp/Fnr family transcriptional regulator n=1 Tax=Polaribacter sp. ALD11 TaxID=2058137 RepID=UPI000C3130B0|nr:Crp/Fnr family transcriptional regulator [Polaribacter sp. ALD11]AUC86016.1 Crp/Fnr family transcriptional regulator [Polaribacter sp. ALD11]